MAYYEDLARRVRDELLVRVVPTGSDDALAGPHTRPFNMAGRRLNGWILMAPGMGGERRLGAWIDRGVAFARSLPAEG